MNNSVSGIPEGRIYMYKGNPYKLVCATKVKINGAWLPAVVYECLYDNPDGQIWVRLSSDFFSKFEPVKQ